MDIDIQIRFLWPSLVNQPFIEHTFYVPVPGTWEPLNTQYIGKMNFSSTHCEPDYIGNRAQKRCLENYQVQKWPKHTLISNSSSHHRKGFQER